MPIALKWKARNKLRRVKMFSNNVREFGLDLGRYFRFSAPMDVGPDARERRHLECQLTMDYHAIEKGFSIHNPKRPFGSEAVPRLRRNVPAAHGTVYGRHAAQALDAIELWNNGDENIPKDLSPAVEGNVTAAARESFRSLITSRHSTRDFDVSRKVPDATIDEAVELALRTPSVCNRQSWGVRVLRNPDNIRRALQYQNGNRGFSEVIPALAIVTVDLRLFQGAHERNQPWIEGGLFAMTLCLALESSGISSCMLNMSAENHTVNRLRADLEIPQHDAVVMMMALGYARPGRRAARSPRRQVAEVLTLD